MTATFTLTGNYAELLGSVLPRTLYVQTAAQIVDSTTGTPVFDGSDSTKITNGTFSIPLPSNDPTNLPYGGSGTPAFGFTITIGKRTWTVPAQPTNSTHDLSEFTTPWAAPPAASDSSTIDSINATLLSNASSATRAGLNTRYLATGTRDVANGVAGTDSNNKILDARIPTQVTRDGVTRWDILKYGVATDGTTLADTAFDALLAQMKSGDILDIPRGATIKLANRRDIAKPITIEGNGATITQASTAGVFRVVGGGDGSMFRNLKGVGPSGTTFATNSKFIMVSGTLGAYVTDVQVENVTGQNWGNGTLEATFARRLTTRNVFTNACMYIGQMFISCEDINLYNPMCDNLQGLSGNSNSYPIAFTRDSNQTLANSPRTTGANVFGGWARNTTWEALDTHAGVSIKVYGYTGKNTKYGIAFVGSQDTTGTNTIYAPIDCWASNCTMDSGVSDGSAGDGYSLVGALGTENASGGFTDCTSTGFGTQGNVSGGSGAVRLAATNSAKVSGLTAVESSPFAVALSGNNFDLRLTDLYSADAWSTTVTTPGLVGIVGDNNRFTLGGAIRMQRRSKSATYVNQAGIVCVSTRTNIEANLAGPDLSGAATALVNMPSGSVVQSQFGVKAVRPTLTSSSTAAQIVAALQGAGVVG